MNPDYCDHCGLALADGGGHSRCLQARELEPPRYCGRCGRRMIVQVTPHGWTGRCSAHGVIAASASQDVSR